MLNLHELEKRWLRYKIKSFLPYFIIVIFLIGLIITVLILSVNFTPPNKTPLKVQEKKLQIPATPQRKMTMQPSLNFMNNLKQSTPQYYQDEVSILPTLPVKKQQVVVKKPVVVAKKEIIVEVPEVTIAKNPIISIQRQDTDEDMQYVIERFKKSNNPTLSLFIAKKYYERAEYNQAYNYALITNGLNNNIEESWIIFTKALVKLNKKDKAIAILKKYINNSNSQRAKVLLSSIKSGKLQ